VQAGAEAGVAQDMDVNAWTRGSMHWLCGEENDALHAQAAVFALFGLRCYVMPAKQTLLDNSSRLIGHVRRQAQAADIEAGLRCLPPTPSVLADEHRICTGATGSRPVGGCALLVHQGRPR
jgi:hypothetical protein